MHVVAEDDMILKSKIEAKHSSSTAAVVFSHLAA